MGAVLGRIWGFCFGFFGPRECFFRVCSLTCRAVSRSHAANSAGEQAATDCQVQGGAEVNQGEVCRGDLVGDS